MGPALSRELGLFFFLLWRKNVCGIEEDEDEGSFRVSSHSSPLRSFRSVAPHCLGGLTLPAMA